MEVIFSPFQLFKVDQYTILHWLILQLAYQIDITLCDRKIVESYFLLYEPYIYE